MNDTIRDLARLTPGEVAHSLRFRDVSNVYARQVTVAYGGDIAAAMRDDPATVAARVAQWERAHGREPRDWPAIGRADGGTGIDFGPIPE